MTGSEPENDGPGRPGRLFWPSAGALTAVAVASTVVAMLTPEDAGADAALLPIGFFAGMAALAMLLGRALIVFTDALAEPEERPVEAHRDPDAHVAVADLRRELRSYQASLRRSKAHRETREPQVTFSEEQAEAIRRMFAAELGRTARAQLRLNIVFFLGGILIPILINLVVQMAAS